MTTNPPQAYGPKAYDELPDGAKVTFHSGAMVVCVKVEGKWYIEEINPDELLGCVISTEKLWRKFASQIR